ncbi:MAG: tRNA (N6-isopentenyl adenosine(37)-C2)-methylthiotransferase MiaB, partial [Bacilli bacterium]|nr:tRNA (N6-isopentenyl adenosine(37)-C2)-methylthiotransferase MiaB [Bacilli bacterium]
MKVDYKLKNEIEEQYKYIEKIRKDNENKNLKYSIFTMGCQLNENDSEKICGMLEKMGYSST